MFTTLQTHFVRTTLVALFISLIASPFTSFFGMTFYPTKDFRCCKGNRLQVNHYFVFNVFWIKAFDGFKEEDVAQSTNAACAIRCN